MTKINIEKSMNADTRSADRLVTKEELLAHSLQHINDVKKAFAFFIEIMATIAQRHDHTKIENIDEFHKDFELIQKGDVEDFKQKHWFQDLHLKERHHLNDRCPEDVNLFDVLERVADITMAGMARTGKVYDDSLPPELLLKAYKNTVEFLKSNIAVSGGTK